MPIKHSYNDVFDSFKNYNCKLLHNEDEFNNQAEEGESNVIIIK